MKPIILAALAAAAFPALAQAAAPELELRDVVAQVRIIPEARGDFAVSVSGQRADLPPIKVSRDGTGVVVDGGLEKRIRSCNMLGAVRIKNGPNVPVKALPQITVRAPLSFAVRTSGYVRGEIAPAQAVDLDVEGCGRWSVANTTRLNASVEGFANIDAGRTRAARIKLEGLGDVDVAAVDGPLHASVEGLGNVHVKGGHVTDMVAQLEGLGSIRFDGVAETLDASADGMGSIRVPNVKTVLRKRVDGLARIKTSN
jgi:hypothetical protein